MNIQNPDEIFNIVIVLIPFYIAYNISSVFSSIFSAERKTWYNFIIAIIVNILYYGIVYGLFLAEIFEGTMLFICLMFGGGMLLNAICGTGLYIFDRKRKIIN